MTAFFITKNSKSPKVFPHSGLTAPDVTKLCELINTFATAFNRHIITLQY